MNIPIRRLLILLSLLSVVLAGAVSPASVIPWEEKVDPWVLQAAKGGTTEFLVYLSTQVDLSGAALLPVKSQKGLYVYQALTSVAERTQKPVIAELDKSGLAYRPYWVANMIWVQAGLDIIRLLASRPDVFHIYANPQVALDDSMEAQVTVSGSLGVEWNIVKVGAPQVWAQGYTGQGVVVGGQDTGFDWDHPALINHYRGTNGTSVDHNYNWYDATSDHSLVPIDPYGHGTPVMGTIVGDDGAGNQIGMAPGARWIGCRNMDRFGVGSPATFAACYQWFMAPTRLDGSSPRPDLAPDVINNSWGCDKDIDGCKDPNVLLAVVQNLRLAGIVTVHSAGNAGSLCGSVNEPAAIYAESFTVGATSSSDQIANFSGRGPVTVDGSGRPKPDISAPGVDVRSILSGGGYALMTGTSIATPHGTGLVALLISAYPALSGQVDKVEQIIERSALHIPAQECGSKGVPNNAYGWGRIDAFAAYSLGHLISLEKHVSSARAAPGDTITYTLTISHVYDLSPSRNVTLTDTIPRGSTFVSATAPYTRTGNNISWNFPNLDASATASVDMVIKVDNHPPRWIVNDDYAVSSEQMAWVHGSPVYTFFGELYFLPLAMLSP